MLQTLCHHLTHRKSKSQISRLMDRIRYPKDDDNNETSETDMSDTNSTEPT